MNIISFLKQEWRKTDKVKFFESVVTGIIFLILASIWLNHIFLPIDEYLKTHTLENTDHIVIFTMLGFLISSLFAGLYLIRFIEYFIIKISLKCYNTIRD